MSYASEILCADNYELFDRVCARLNAKPIEPIDIIASDIGVTVDELCRWVIAYRAPKHKRPPYQSPKLAPIAQPRRDTGPVEARSHDAQRFLAWKKASEGAREARLAAEEKA